MAMATTAQAVQDEDNVGFNQSTNGTDDPFTAPDHSAHQPYSHRFSSRFDLDATDLGAASSPSQLRRVLEAHLLETERRLQDTHKLGTSLLQQQSELQEKLQEVEQQQDEAEISPELKQRLASIGREHDDVSREIARSLLAPKSRAVSGEDKSTSEATTLTSQATGSPTKISAPNRRSRNQPVNRAGDLQFAADISTSLLAQVRQLQAAVAERDVAIKTANTERSKLEQDVQLLAQKMRSHDENEQRFKDENWNLEAQNHELLTAQRDATDKEKRLNAAIAIANAEKSRLLNEIEESKLAHSRVSEDHEASKKAHETELHSLKRDFDSADADRSLLQKRIDDLTAQNQELAKGISTRFRNQSPQRQPQPGVEDDALAQDLSTPEHSPPPSPTKATPRHGGLESETLRSSLHHAQRMIQNLKSNIHREKTEKIELKRMLQDARDELEQRENEPGVGTATKKPKPRGDVFKKPARSDMLGNNRRVRTDVELQDGEWIDQGHDSPSQAGPSRSTLAMTDVSDAYQTAHETESNFETADEQMTTESEAFETGAESLAGDSTDDLTETESTAPRSLQRGSARHSRPSLTHRSAGNRDSYLSTASTSAGEEDIGDDLQTPVQPQPHRFKLRNGRSAIARQTQIYEGTPDSLRSEVTSRDSPATVVDGRSPPGVEQSLFAELEGIHDSSSNFSTPAKLGVASVESTPGIIETPSKSTNAAVTLPTVPKPIMVDSAMMTEPWQPKAPTDQVLSTGIPDKHASHVSTELTPEGTSRAVSIGDFPLPPSASKPSAMSMDAGTQYTPQKSSRSASPSTPQHIFETNPQYTPSKAVQDSPMRGSAFITPPRTVWDAEHESEIGSPERNVQMPKATLTYSRMLALDTTPLLPTQPVAKAPATMNYSNISSQHTQPIAPMPSPPPTIPLPAVPETAKAKNSNATEGMAGAATGGIIAGAAAALGLSWAKNKNDATEVTEDENDGPVVARSVDRAPTPSESVSKQAVLRQKHSTDNIDLSQGMPITVSSNDQSSQTLLTSYEIEQALQAKRTANLVPGVTPFLVDATPEVPPKSLARSPDIIEKPATTTTSAPSSPPLRPSSASSWRPATASKQHPPLPSNYKSNIARANSLAQGAGKRESNAPAVGTVMGPPLMPASAMRRPKTPAESTRSPPRDNATPRFAGSTRQRGNAGSQLSHRSSISSFASELDDRFNIHTGAAAYGYEPAPGTDPRMIQAITQTMIGEYLWKYTRKPGSKDMSSTRHRRYFWVHPYTKTLYWSTTDPSTPASKEGKSRSVPIESIRVVTDDNPMPPGLHRKSLEVTTPNRKLKFTATTGQRHETWFNALSYLLLRGEAPDTYGAYSTGGNEITRDDLEEFRASGHDPHLVPASRQSMSSYNSRTTAGTSKRVSGPATTGQRQALPSNVVSTSNNSLRHQASLQRNSSVPPTTESGRDSRADQVSGADKDRTIRARSMSRVSRVLGSITGKSGSRHGAAAPTEVQQNDQVRGPSRESNSIYDASVVSAARDSAEETRQEMLRQEAAGLGSSAGLENVRACCDGKHDVSTLSHNHRHSEKHRALNSMSDRINRSMSKRV